MKVWHALTAQTAVFQKVGLPHRQNIQTLEPQINERFANDMTIPTIRIRTGGVPDLKRACPVASIFVHKSTYRQKFHHASGLQTPAAYRSFSYQAVCVALDDIEKCPHRSERRRNLVVVVQLGGQVCDPHGRIPLQMGAPPQGPGGFQNGALLGHTHISIAVTSLWRCWAELRQ